MAPKTFWDRPHHRCLAARATIRKVVVVGKARVKEPKARQLTSSLRRYCGIATKQSSNPDGIRTVRYWLSLEVGSKGPTYFPTFISLLGFIRYRWRGSVVSDAGEQRRIPSLMDPDNLPRLLMGRFPVMFLILPPCLLLRIFIFIPRAWGMFQLFQVLACLGRGSNRLSQTANRDGSSAAHGLVFLITKIATATHVAPVESEESRGLNRGGTQCWSQFWGTEGAALLVSATNDGVRIPTAPTSLGVSSRRMPSIESMARHVRACHGAGRDVHAIWWPLDCLV